MKKIFTCALIFSIISSAISQNRYSYLEGQFGDDTVFAQCIDEYEKAFKELYPYKDDIKVTIWSEASGNTITTHYEYTAPSPQVEEYLKNYQEITSIISSKLFMHALGDGFLLGILAAGLNRAISPKKINNKLLAGGALATIGMIILQHNCLPKVPFLSKRLKEEANLFNSGETMVSCVLALCGSGISLLGSNYLINKISGLYRAYKAK